MTSTVIKSGQIQRLFQSHRNLLFIPQETNICNNNNNNIKLFNNCKDLNDNLICIFPLCDLLTFYLSPLRANF